MCLDSTAKQTYLNIEIILINDGLSDTRYEGLRRSQGKFISFIDSDGWIDPTYVEDLYKVALLNDSEVVVSNYKEFHQEQNVYLMTITREIILGRNCSSNYRF
ncbi:glycosyltransferase family A protein [Streptococcus mitis]|jgi:hypothetical protein|uniref:glycosyltransferase family A protein n=1 Tax=Streptococcus mitis TaxID=28037 RepID=UPI0034D9609B